LWPRLRYASCCQTLVSPCGDLHFCTEIGRRGCIHTGLLSKRGNLPRKTGALDECPKCCPSLSLITISPLASSPSSASDEYVVSSPRFRRQRCAMEETTISSQYEATRSKLDALKVQSLLVTDNSKARSPFIEDQQGRLRIWAANIGVNAGGHASLDYRLRDGWEARKITIDLLQSLQDHANRGLPQCAQQSRIHQLIH
jgi:hypothetical protein